MDYRKLSMYIVISRPATKSKLHWYTVKNTLVKLKINIKNVWIIQKKLGNGKQRNEKQRKQKPSNKMVDINSP